MKQVRGPVRVEIHRHREHVNCVPPFTKPSEGWGTRKSQDSTSKLSTRVVLSSRKPSVVETTDTKRTRVSHPPSASNPTDTWTTPFGDAVHAMTDSTSAVHRNNGIPISWPILPNALHHGSNSDWPGSSFGSGESWANVTPQLMQENINLIQAAYRQVTGLSCAYRQ
jgi:hypothetical protein